MACFSCGWLLHLGHMAQDGGLMKRLHLLLAHSGHIGLLLVGLVLQTLWYQIWFVLLNEFDLFLIALRFIIFEFLRHLIRILPVLCHVVIIGLKLMGRVAELLLKGVATLCLIQVHGCKLLLIKHIWIMIVLIYILSSLGSWNRLLLVGLVSASCSVTCGAAVLFAPTGAFEGQLLGLVLICFGVTRMIECIKVLCCRLRWKVSSNATTVLSIALKLSRYRCRNLLEIFLWVIVLFILHIIEQIPCWFVKKFLLGGCASLAS